MANFSPNIKGRAWVGTVHIKNMEKAGLTEENYSNPTFLANYLVDTWSSSGKNRSAAATVCKSKDGLYHAHVALYGNLTTLKNVSKIMFDSHIEPQLGGKKELTGYLAKESSYSNGEQVLCTLGLENIQEIKGKRSDLEEIDSLLKEGLTPSQIMEKSFSYRRFEKMIKSAYSDKRIKEAPPIKNTRNEWHVGDSGTGKTYYYYQLCEKYGVESVYLASDYKNGGFDFYIDQGAPPILFLDEFKENMDFGQLLTILDKYSRLQSHCRYYNTYNLWTTCIITSIFPPDEVYSEIVEDRKKHRDKIGQLLRRLDVVVYHYKENDEFKTFSLPACEYQNYNDLRQKALAGKDGFIPLRPDDANPFNTGNHAIRP